MKNVKCCLNVGIIVTVGKVKYKETRQTNRDLMLQTRDLTLAAHRPEMFCLDYTVVVVVVVVLNLSQNFKVG